MLVRWCDFFDELIERPLTPRRTDRDRVAVDGDVDVSILADLCLGSEGFGDANREAVSPSLNGCNHLARFQVVYTMDILGLRAEVNISALSRNVHISGGRSRGWHRFAGLTERLEVELDSFPHDSFDFCPSRNRAGI